MSRRGRCHRSTVAVLDGGDFGGGGGGGVDPFSAFVASSPTPLNAAFLYLAAAATNAVAGSGGAAADAPAAAADAAAAAASSTGEKASLWNGFVSLIESMMTGIHDGLSAVGVPYSYGFAIIIFTVLVKSVTFPLNFKQMKSTMSMQALAPKVKELQARYRDNPQVLNKETARLYQTAKVNPLTGCLPVLVQLPVWIALYRALLNLAAQEKLIDGFFWIPSLQGPVRQGQGLSTWLFPFKDGAPPAGWHDAIAYLVLPVLLVASQFVSQRLLQPATQDPQQKQANVVLKFLPFMIGWFSLNVPSGLGLYWVTNNLVSTVQTVAIRRYLAARDPELAAVDGGGGGGGGGSSSTSSNGAMRAGQGDVLNAAEGFGSDGGGGGGEGSDGAGDGDGGGSGSGGKRGKRKASKKKKR